LRVADLRTFSVAAPTADTRVLTASTTTANVDGPMCDAVAAPVTVQGTTLETPAPQPNGGGFNSSLSVPSVTPGTPLANGASVNVDVLLGVMQPGQNAIDLVAEATPGNGAAPPVQCLGLTVGGDVTDICGAVGMAPIIGTTFTPTPVSPNGTSSLGFTVANPGAAPLTGVAFTDTLPAGLVVSTPNALTGTCGGGTITATAASGAVTLAGATLAGGASCTFSLNVTATTTGAKNNLVQVTSGNAGAGNTASATLSVTGPPAFSKAFGAPSIGSGGTTSLTFTLTNPAANTVPLSGIAFTDTLPAGMTVASPNALTNTCNVTPVAIAGSGSVSLSGGTLAIGATCTLAVNVTATAGGNYTNTTGTISSSEGGTGGTASAPLTVVADAAPVVTVPDITGTEKSPATGPLVTFTDSDGTATASHYTATVDWGDGTTPTSATITGAAGSFSVATGMHTYDFGAGGAGTVHLPLPAVAVTVTDVTVPANKATGTGHASITDLSDNDSWVLQIYRDLFGRDPDAPGRSFWVGALNGGTSRTAVAGAITNSDEYRAIPVRSYYTTYLGRAADAGGLTAYLGILRSGGTLQGVQASILSSSEYFAGHGAGTNATFVDHLYLDVAGRPADAGGKAYWLAQLSAGATRSDVAYAFLWSSEYKAGVITTDYQLTLHRPADSGGGAYWTGQINAGVRFEDVIAALLASTEYFTRAQ
jgi:uncharacterized repeat protein (TIGR01451 family)